MTRAADPDVGDPRSPGGLRDELQALYESKVRSELDTANELAPGTDIIAYSGELLAQVALVKGLPGPAEAAGGSALSGPDGVAADNALTALGYEPSAAFKMLSRPEPDLDAAKRVARVRQALEAVDAAVVVALDAEAAEDVRQALGLERLTFGRPVRVSGRTIVAVDGLEASLGDTDRKKRVWRQLRSIGV